MATTLSTTIYEQVGTNSPLGMILCSTSSDKVGFWGKVPVAQRAYVASVHNTTALASSTDFAAGQTAILAEVMNTLIGLGIYATA
jgi:hypothetical protein